MVNIAKTLLVLGLAVAQQATAPVFEGKSTLLRPENYREWVFVGSSLGLSYTQNAPAQEQYHNVYINPSSYRGFTKTGKFPEGTMMAMEVISAGTKIEPGLHGSFEKDFIRLEVSVKDTKRFEGGWAYFDFSGGGSLKAKAEPFPVSAGCVACHKQNAETDNVFTQFYPVLRAVKPK